LVQSVAHSFIQRYGATMKHRAMRPAAVKGKKSVSMYLPTNKLKHMCAQLRIRD
jgi:hypothetical protein